MARNTFRKIIGTVVSLTGLSALLSSGLGWSSEYSDEWGPDVGTALPLLEAPDQSGNTRTLADLSGKQGLLLFLNRSADW